MIKRKLMVSNLEEEQQGKQKATYGEAILKTLTAALTAQLGKGFSYANLCNFRQFYITYPGPKNCYALRSNLSCMHYRLIIKIYLVELPSRASGNAVTTRPVVEALETTVGIQRN